METLRFLMISTHFPPHHLGGDAVLVEYLSTELARRGHEVHVIHMPAVYEYLRHKESSGKNTNDSPIMHPMGMKHATFNLFRTLSFGTPKEIERRIHDLTNQIKPDVTHWHNTKGFVGTPLRTKTGRSLFTAHDYYAICPRSNLLRPDLSICGKETHCQFCHIGWRKPLPLWRMGKNRLLKIPSDMTVISPSSYLAGRLEEEGLKDIKVLRNFVPDPGMMVSEGPAKTNRLLYLGMLERHKGPQTLVEAFHRTKDRHDFQLDIVGDGTLKEHLMARIKTLGLEKRVRVTGFLSREELNQIRQNAAAQIIPSEWPENAPLTALEALSIGTPLIGSDYGGLPEILRPESGCRTFKGGDVSDLGEILINRWEERDDESAMRRSARKAYEAQFTPDRHIKSYLEIIRAEP